MANEKGILSGNTTMLVLRLLEGMDMYGYQIIETLAAQSDETFRLKTGTLYPILHGLENDGAVTSHEEMIDNARVRKYYRLTSKGKGLLKKKKEEWESYTKAVGRVLKGGARYAFA